MRGGGLVSKVNMVLNVHKTVRVIRDGVKGVWRWGKKEMEGS